MSVAAAERLVAALRDPASVSALDVAGWTDLLTAARAERLLGSLALRVDQRAKPPGVSALTLAERSWDGQA